MVMKKSIYQKPTMKVVKLCHQPALLAGSSPEPAEPAEPGTAREYRNDDWDE